MLLTLFSTHAFMFTLSSFVAIFFPVTTSISFRLMRNHSCPSCRQDYLNVNTDANV